MTSFTAHFCFTDTNGNSFKAGLADAEFNTCHYIMFEKLKNPDEQDLKLGFDAAYLEFSDQGNSGYGLIEKIEVTSLQLRIFLNAKGAKALQTSLIEVGLDNSIRREEFIVVMKLIIGASLVVLDERNPQ